MIDQSTLLDESTTEGRQALPSGWGTKNLRAIAGEISKQIKPSNNPTAIYNYWSLDSIRKGQFTEPEPNFVAGSTIGSTTIEFGADHILYSKFDYHTETMS